MSSSDQSGYDNFIQTLRKPELRTKHSNLLIETTREYFEEIYRQKPLPEILTRFKDLKGVVIPFGSALLGGSERESDLDIYVVYDGKTLDPQIHPAQTIFWQYVSYRPTMEDFTDILGGSAHPDNIGLIKYTAEKLGVDIATFYYDTHIRPVDINLISDAISAKTELTNFEKRFICDLLTTVPEFTFEAENNDLLNAQIKVVQSLQTLYSTDKQAFKTFYSDLNNILKSKFKYFEDQHIDRDDSILEQYIKSGKPGITKMDRAVRLLRSIRDSQNLPSPEILFAHFLK